MVMRRSTLIIIATINNMKIVYSIAAFALAVLATSALPSNALNRIRSIAGLLKWTNGHISNEQSFLNRTERGQ